MNLIDQCAAGPEHFQGRDLGQLLQVIRPRPAAHDDSAVARFHVQIADAPMSAFLNLPRDGLCDLGATLVVIKCALHGRTHGW